MRIHELKAPVFIEIVKRGPGDYAYRCDACGKREDLPGSLGQAKIAVKAHRSEHEAYEREVN